MDIQSINRKILSNLEELNVYLDSSNYFSLDTETTGLNTFTDSIVGISIYNNKDTAFYIPINHLNYENNFDIKDIVNIFNLKFKNKILIFHNMIFDATMLRKYGFNPCEFAYFDTMVAAHLINELRSCGLKNLSKQEFNYKMQEFDFLKKGYKNASYVPVKEMYYYACDDAIITFFLFVKFRKEITNNKLSELYYNIEMPFLEVLINIKEYGIKFDLELLNSYKSEIEKDISNLESEIFKYNKGCQRTLFDIGMPFDINSNKQLSNFLFNVLKLPVILKSEKTDTPLTGFEVLDELKGKHPVIDLLLKYKRLSKIYHGYILSLPKKVDTDGKIRTDFLIHGTKTGRMCVAKGTKIKTTKGQINIESLCDETKEMEFVNIINKNIIIYSKEGKRLVKNSIYKGIKNTLIITVDNGNKIEGTYDHLLFNGTNFIQLRYLKINDNLPIYKNNKISYHKIISIQKSKNKVYDIQVLRKDELEKLYYSKKDLSIKQISKNWGLTYKQTNTIFYYYNIKKKPFSDTSNRELLRKQKIGNKNPMFNKIGKLHHNFGKKFCGEKHSISRKNFLKLNPIKYKSPITNKIVDYLTYNKHINIINHNTKEYKERASKSMKDWFSKKENKEKFKESMMKIPKELKKKYSSMGGKAYVYKLRNDIDFKNKMSKKLSKALMGHSVSEETKKKIRDKVKGYKHTEQARAKIRKKRSEQINVSPGYLGTKVNYFSNKFNKEFNFKSKYEYRFLKACENNNNIIDLDYEPLKINYKSSHYYTPDFRIINKKNEVLFVEIKGDYLYNKFKDKYDEIFNYMRNNYNFKVFFTKELENFEKGVIDV